MVELIKILLHRCFFVATELPVKGFPLPDFLFPEKVASFAQTYLTTGWGSTTLILLFVFLLTVALFYPREERWIARLGLIIIGLWWPIELTYNLKISQFAVNLFFLPILKVPIALVYGVLAFIFTFLTLRIRSQFLTDRKVSVWRWLFDLCAFILLLSFLWPLTQIPFVRW
jgi:hypothetical protein